MVRDLLNPLIRLLDLTRDSHAVHATMWTLAHDGMLRSKELLALKIEDVVWHTDRATLKIHDNKNSKLPKRPQLVHLDNEGPISAL
jgi:integrase